MSIARAFEIVPAIDLRGGKVVRLQQGDFARETVYSDDPVAVARGFADAGAGWLHVVDLDGARAGEPVNGASVEAIVQAVGERIGVEVAGGLRSAAAVASVLAIGAARAVIGTAALQDPAFVGDIIARHGTDRIVVAIDVRDGLAVGHGWVPGTPGVAATDAISRLADVGVATFEVTAIDRDGLLGGPDLGLYEGFIALDRGSIIASGGIARLDDLRGLRGLGCAGAIVGRALLDGSMDLRDAIDTVATRHDPHPLAG
jgi:phosphoribosylformimino-5-aminoimidazole carboxamide ribotide isomerase